MNYLNSTSLNQSVFAVRSYEIWKVVIETRITEFKYRVVYLKLCNLVAHRHSSGFRVCINIHILD